MRRNRFRINVLIAVILVSFIELGYSAPFNAELNYRFLHTEKSYKPILTQDTIIFSYLGAKKTRTVSIAFEHDQFRQLYTCQKNPHNVFVLFFPRPEGMTVLRYRFIVDGLWTIDPNADIESDNHGIQISVLSLPEISITQPTGVSRLSDRAFRFAYEGNTGSRVSVIGDFNRWDPFLIPLEESLIQPGYYSTVVDIPETARYYRYVVDGKEIIDPANKRVQRNRWGESASILP